MKLGWFRGRLWAGGCVCILSLLLARSVQADSIIGTPIDWEDAHDPITAWDRLGTAATILEMDTGGEGNATDWLKITLGNDAADTVKGASADLFVGKWQPEYWVEFDFWANDLPPAVLQIRWADSAGGRVWGNTISPSGAGGWNTLRTDSFLAANWDLQSGAGGGAEFVADLGSIDWIGVYILAGATGTGEYGVDDFKLMVPEPAEYLMLASALITAFLVMRRRNLVPPPLQPVALG